MSRSDGLDNPLSPNCNRLTWDEVWERCEASDAVKLYDENNCSIVWVGEQEAEKFVNPEDAWNAISVMEAP